jgi:hypothetical protein
MRDGKIRMIGNIAVILRRKQNADFFGIKPGSESTAETKYEDFVPRTKKIINRQKRVER